MGHSAEKDAPLWRRLLNRLARPPIESDARHYCAAPGWSNPGEEWTCPSCGAKWLAMDVDYMHYRWSRVTPPGGSDA